jgi:hypothetical protein
MDRPSPASEHGPNALLTSINRTNAPHNLLGLLRDYEAHYNSHRPHRGIDLNPPERNGFGPRAVRLDQIERTSVVGGLINEYHGEAA